MSDATKPRFIRLPGGELRCDASGDRGFPIRLTLWETLELLAPVAGEGLQILWVLFLLGFACTL